MNSSLPKQKKLVPISEAAQVLGVSIDTIRRWDKKGLLHSARVGKNRYFSIFELEKIKFAKPLPISAASKYLGISQSTLRRLEEKGLIKPDRNEAGERVYDRQSLEQFLNSEYFLRQKKIEEKILEPLKQPSQTVSDQSEPPTHKVLNVLQQETRQEVSKLLTFRKIFYISSFSLVSAFILIISLITMFFLLFPSQTAKFFGYKEAQVLGVKYPASKLAKGQVLGVMFKPISDLSLQIVKQISLKTYQKIVPERKIADINDVFTIDEKGNLKPKIDIKLPDASYLVVEGKNGKEVQLVQKNGEQSATNALVLPDCSANQILSWDGTAWVCASQTGLIKSINSLTGGLTISGAGINSVSESGSKITITGSEADTLSSVVGRGATTTTAVTFGQVDTTGNLGVGKSLTVTSAGVFSAGIKVSAGADLTSLTTSGNAGIGGSLTVTSGLSLPNSSIINANLVNSALTISAGTGLTGGGSVSLGSSVTLNAAQDISTTASPTFTNLTLTGNIGVGGSLVSTGNVGVGRSLSVTNLGVFNSGLNVTGLSNLTGNVGVGTSLTVTSAAVFSSGIKVSGTADLTTLSTTGASTLGSTLAVTGVTTLSASNAALSFTGTTPSLTSGGSVFGLFSGGNVGIGTTGNIYGGLTVRGSGTSTGITLQTYGSGLGQGLTVLDNGNVGVGTTSPDYNFRVNGTLFSSGFVGIGSSLNVSGNVGIGSSLTTTSAAVFNGGLVVNGGSVTLPSSVITNANLVNSALTISAGTGLTGGGSVSLGSSVTLNAAQDISTTASPTFTNLTLTGNIGVGGSLVTTGNVGIGKSLTVTSAAVFSVLGSGVVQSNSSGGLSSGAVNLGSSTFVSGVLGATNGGTGQSSWTTGDLLYASGTNTLSKLGIGSAGQALVVSGGLPAWGTGSQWTTSAPNIYFLGTTGAGNVGIGNTYANYGKLQLTGAGTGTGITFQTLDSAGTQRFTILDNGNVGIGTTSPVGALHVVGQCVTPDTKLKRRKRNKKGELTDEYEEIEIKDIKEGDQILSLNETNGQFESHTVKGLMDMGRQEVFLLTTQDNLRIETTANHPYLTIEKGIKKYQDRQAIFEVDLSSRFEEMITDTIVAAANKDYASILRITSKEKLKFRKLFRKEPKLFAPTLYALSIVEIIKKAATQPTQLKIDTDYISHERRIEKIINYFYPDIVIQFKQVGKNSPAHIAALTTFRSQKKKTGVGSNLKGFPTAEQLHHEWLHGPTTHTVLSFKDYHKFEDLSNTTWKKVAYLKPGDTIATIYGWQKISSIYSRGKKPTFDIEVENTHNFVGNNIVAHNTYISGNLGVGFSTPTSQFQVNSGSSAFTVSSTGNVGVGTSLTVTSAAVFSSGIKVSGTSDLTTLSTTGASTLGSTLAVTGVTTLSANNAALSFTGTTPSLTSGSSVFGLFAGGNVGIGTTGNVYGGLTVRGAGTSTGITLQTYGSGLGQGLTVLDNGNVGIGTTSPDYTFRTQGTGFFSGFVGIGSSLNVSGNVGVGGSITTTGLTYAQGGLRVNGLASLTGATDLGGLLTLSSSGMTGGGLASCSDGTNSKLLWNSSTSNFSCGTDQNTGGSSSQWTTSAPNIYFIGTAGAGNVGIGNTYANYSKLQLTGAGTGTGLTFQTLDSAGTQRFSVLDNGNVGIGTTGPGSALSVIGNVGIGTSAAGAPLQTNGGGIFWQTTASLTGPSNGLAIQGNLGIGTTTANNPLSVVGAASFGTYSQLTAPSNGLIVSGNTGIGTSAPQGVLDVNGTSFLRGVVTTTGNVGVGASITGFGALNGLNVTGLSNLAGALNVNGASTLSSTLSVTGVETLSANNAALSFTGSTPSISSGANSFSIFAGGNIGIGISSPLSAALTVRGLGTGTGITLQTYGSNLTQGLTVLDNGNLGVGTTSPDYNFRVNGTGFFSGFVGIGSSLNTSGNVGVGASLTTTGLTYASGGLRVNGFSDLTGNVGIGSSLTVTSAGVFSAGIKVSAGADLTTLSTTGAGTLGGLLTLSSSGMTGGGLASCSDGTNSKLLWNSSTNNFSCGTDQNTGGSSSQWTTSAPNIYFIGTAGAGNVGIGNTYANFSKLQVTGAGTGTGLTFQTLDSSGTQRFTILDNGNVGIGTTGPGGSLIVSSGNVGIGFTSPDRKFQIAGDLNSGSNLVSTLLGTAGSQFDITGSTANNLQKKLGIGLDTTNNYGFIQAGANLGVGSSAAYNLIINPAGGNIGIGTTITNLALTTISGNVGVGVTSGATSAILRLVSDDGLNGNVADILTLTHSTTGTATGETTSGNDSSTVLLIKAGGSNGSTTFTDSSTSAKSITANADAKVSTAQSKWGGSSAVFDGTGDYLSTADHADWDCTTVDCTIDFWVRLNTLTVAPAYIGQANSGSDGNWFIYSYTTGSVCIGINGTNEICTATGLVTTGTWYHIAVTRKQSSSTTKIYINGVEKASATTAVWNNATTEMRIGAISSTVNNMDGWMDEIRFSRTLRWSAAFNPPTSAYGSSAVTGIGSGLLLQAEDAAGQLAQIARIMGTFTEPASGFESSKMIFQTRNEGGSLVNRAHIDGVGNMIIAGSLIQSGSPDIAENVKLADNTIEAGDVVAVDRSYTPNGSDGTYNRFRVVKSARSYDSQVLGIISEKPGVVINAPRDAVNSGISSAEGEKPMAISGRVPVKVSTESGSISIGDYLTSSSTPGVAMRATRPGYVVGKAMENFDCASTRKTGQIGSTCFGKILAMVQLPFVADPQNTLANLRLDDDGSLIVPRIKASSFFIDQSIATKGLIAKDGSPISDEKEASNSAALSLETGSFFSLFNKFSSLDSEVKKLQSGKQDKQATSSADLAEYYGTVDKTIEAGDVVVAGGGSGEKSLVAKATQPYQKTLLGIVSTQPSTPILGDTFQKEDNPRPVALSGRVPVKVSLENGAIEIGDSLTSSATPGVAMKATKPGVVVGKALEDYDGEGIGKILVFVNVTFADPQNLLTNLNFDTQSRLVVNEIVTKGLTLVEEPVELTKLDLTTAESTSSAVLSLSKLIQSLGQGNVASPSAKLNLTEVLASISAHLNKLDQTATVSANLADKIKVGQEKTTFQALVEFLDNVIFRGHINFLGDVNFLGGTTFKRIIFDDKDTAGFAIINKDADNIPVTFDKEYSQTPLINISITLDNNVDEASQSAIERQVLDSDIKFIVTRKNTKGFTIKLSKAAPIDLTFSWIALAVKDAKIVRSKEASASATPSPTPQPTASASAELKPLKIKINNNELGYLRVREEATTASEEVGQVLPEQIYEVLIEKIGWYKIEYKKDFYGWIKGAYVTKL